MFSRAALGECVNTLSLIMWMTIQNGEVQTVPMKIQNKCVLHEKWENINYESKIEPYEMWQTIINSIIHNLVL